MTTQLYFTSELDTHYKISKVGRKYTYFNSYNAIGELISENIKTRWEDGCYAEVSEYTSKVYRTWHERYAEAEREDFISQVHALLKSKDCTKNNLIYQLTNDVGGRSYCPGDNVSSYVKLPTRSTFLFPFTAGLSRLSKKEREDILEVGHIEQYYGKTYALSCRLF